MKYTRYVKLKHHHQLPKGKKYCILLHYKNRHLRNKWCVKVAPLIAPRQCTRKLANNPHDKLPDLLQSLQIISQLHVQCIRDNLRIFPILVILLPIQKPVWDLELAWVCNNDHKIIQLSSS